MICNLGEPHVSRILPLGARFLKVYPPISLDLRFGLFSITLKNASQYPNNWILIFYNLGKASLIFFSISDQAKSQISTAVSRKAPSLRNLKKETSQSCPNCPKDPGARTTITTITPAALITAAITAITAMITVITAITVAILIHTMAPEKSSLGQYVISDDGKFRNTLIKKDKPIKILSQGYWILLVNFKTGLMASRLVYFWSLLGFSGFCDWSVWSELRLWSGIITFFSFLQPTSASSFAEAPPVLSSPPSNPTRPPPLPTRPQIPRGVWPVLPPAFGARIPGSKWGSIIGGISHKGEGSQVDRPKWKP